MGRTLKMVSKAGQWSKWFLYVLHLYCSQAYLSPIYPILIPERDLSWLDLFHKHILFCSFWLLSFYNVQVHIIYWCLAFTMKIAKWSFKLNMSLTYWVESRKRSTTKCHCKSQGTDLDAQGMEARGISETVAHLYLASELPTASMWNTLL